jgi:hypothetical protein
VTKTKRKTSKTLIQALIPLEIELLQQGKIDAYQRLGAEVY